MGTLLARAGGFHREGRGLRPMGDGERWPMSSNEMTPSDGVSESALWGL